MKRLSAPFGTTLLVLLAAAASQVRADYLNWTYTGTANTPGITVGATSASGGASVLLTDFGTPQPGAASIPVQAYVTSTSVTSPITFGSSVNTPSTYNLALTITDNTTHDFKTLNFTGSIAGALSATSSTLVNTLIPVTSNTLTLNGYQYTITIPNLTLAAPTSPQQDIMANVSVTPSSSPGTPNPGTPEPTSLLLGSLGISCFGIRCWWKRRVERGNRLVQAA